MNRAFIAASDTTCNPAALTGLFPMRTFTKLLVVAGMLGLVVGQADAGEFFVPGPGGYRYPPPYGHRYGPRHYMRGYVPRYVPPPQYHSDPGAAIAGAIAGAALQLIPKAAAALEARPAPAPPPPPSAPTSAMAPPAEPPNGDVLDQIAGNPRGITRGEVEAALLDWCASHGEAPLCVKLRVP
jgi:hypothetical protein